MTLLISISFVVDAAAGIYRWTDENGNVHFGDKPVDAGSATELKIDASRKSGITNSSVNKFEREYLLKKIEEEKQEQAEARSKRLAERKQRRVKCNALKSDYQAHILRQFGFFIKGVVPAIQLLTPNPAGRVFFLWRVTP